MGEASIREACGIKVPLNSYTTVSSQLVNWHKRSLYYINMIGRKGYVGSCVAPKSG